MPREAWKTWEEDYKVTYPEYVAVQTEKFGGAQLVAAEGGGGDERGAFLASQDGEA